jgi:phage shock protein C
MADQNNSFNNEENFFDRIDKSEPLIPLKRLQRSRSNLIIAGVCAGLGEYLKIDIAKIRLIALLSFLLGGWSITVYLIAAALLPKEPICNVLSVDNILSKKKENFRTVLSGLLILFGLHFGLEFLGIRNNGSIFLLPSGFIFPIISIAVGVYLFTIKEFEQSNETGILSQTYFRSRSDRLFTGVCGGLASYINTDSSSLRIIFIIITLLTLGLFAVIYFIFTILTKYEPESYLEFPQ